MTDEELRVVREALRALVAVSPLVEGGFDGEFWVCHYCRSEDAAGDDDVVHASDCVWLAAASLVESQEQPREAT